MVRHEYKWGLYQASHGHVLSACWENPGPEQFYAQSGTSSPSERPPSCDPGCSVWQDSRVDHATEGQFHLGREKEKNEGNILRQNNSFP